MKKLSHILIVHLFDISITFMNLERGYRLFWIKKMIKRTLKLKLQDYTNWPIQEHHFWLIDHSLFFEGKKKDVEAFENKEVEAVAKL